MHGGERAMHFVRGETRTVPLCVLPSRVLKKNAIWSRGCFDCVAQLAFITLVSCGRYVRVRDMGRVSR